MPRVTGGHDVLQILRARRSSSSTPGKRADRARVALVVEGGSSRGAYSSGMAVTIERRGLVPVFDAVYGSSAGALNAAWLLAGAAEQSSRAWWDDEIMRTTISPSRLLRGRPVVDTDHLIGTVYERLLPAAFERVLQSPIEFHPIATSATSGVAVDLAGTIRDASSLKAALRASTAMPLLTGPPISIQGDRYIDAGVSEAVPVRTALAQGATHVVVLRTKRADELPTSPSSLELRLTNRWFERHAPGAAEKWRNRAHVRAREEEMIRANSCVLQIRPPLGSATIGRTERDVVRLEAAVRTGIDAAEAALEPAIR